jgi:hypothetical protein
MTRKLRKKATATPARRAPATDVIASEIPLAASIRALHHSVAARALASPNAHALRAFADSLTNLEADYRRMAKGTEVTVSPPAPRPAGRKPPRPSAAAGRAVRDTIIEMAGLKSGDVVYVAGPGAGAIARHLAKRRGVEVLVVEDAEGALDPVRSRVSRSRVASRVRFSRHDLFDLNLHRVTVLVLLASRLGGAALSRQLLDRLRPSTRIVSHDVDLGTWASRESRAIDGRPVRCWIVPARR